MGQVNVTINNRQFRMGCADGEEDHLASLAKSFDDRISEMRSKFGQVGNDRLTIMAALTIAECGRIVERTRDGRTYRQRAVDAAMQVPTHALYHNAQISFMFRSMGKALPDSSWIGWARERQGC